MVEGRCQQEQMNASFFCLVAEKYAVLLAGAELSPPISFRRWNTFLSHPAQWQSYVYELLLMASRWKTADFALLDLARKSSEHENHTSAVQVCEPPNENSASSPHISFSAQCKAAS